MDDIISDVSFQGGRFSKETAETCISAISDVLRGNAKNFDWSSFGESIGQTGSGLTLVRTTASIRFELASPRVRPTFREIEITRSRISRIVDNDYWTSAFVQMKPVGETGYEVIVTYVSV